MPCGERCAPSYWRRAGSIKPRNLRQIPCIGPIRAARLLALSKLHTASVASDNSGLTADWALRPTTVPNIATYADNCYPSGSVWHHAALGKPTTAGKTESEAMTLRRVRRPCNWRLGDG
jgi:hypothetical protein